MKSIHKALVIGAAGVTLAAGLTGCSASSGADDGTIEIWYRPGSLPTASIEGVKDQFPDVKIKLVETPDVDTKLTAALRAGKGIPDIAVALLSQYTSVYDRFVDVNEYGFKDVADDYLEWKLQMGQDGEGRQIGVPIDIGPFGFFYRADVFEEAGLPTDPAEVGALVANWDGYRKVAEAVTQATGSFVCDGANSNYVADRLSQGYYYATEAGEYDPDNKINHDAFVSAVKFGQADLCANLALWTPEWSAGIAQGQLTGWVGPSYVAGQMTGAGGDGAGQWRVTTPPGGAASQFGSFLSVFKTSSDPEAATQIAEWLTNPENQAHGYADNSLFPSTPSSFEMPQMTQPEDFYGGQVPSTILGQVAEDAPRLVIIPQSDKAAALFGDAINEAVLAGTDPEDAYKAALAKADDLK